MTADIIRSLSIATILRTSRAPCLAALAGLVFLTALLLLCRGGAVDGQYYQPWPSERMMQTVALEDLRADPWGTLDHIHIQPPAFDALRAAIAAAAPPGNPATTERFVDLVLLMLGVLCYAALGGLAYAWARAMAGPRTATAAAAAVMLHPATIFYATTLESTFVTGTLTLALFYALWRVRSDSDDGGTRAAVALAVVYLVLFFTRSLYQWPFPFILAGALAMRGASRRAVIVFLLITLPLTGQYMFKQFDRFGLVTTSSFAGFNLVRAVDIDDSEAYLHLLDGATPQQGAAAAPSVLTRTHVRSGFPNYNHQSYLDESHRLLGQWLDYMRTMPAEKLARSYLFNAWLFIQPSSRYTRHAAVDRLPGRRVADRLTAYPLILVTWFGALGLSLAAARRRGELKAQFGLLMPAAIIVLVVIVCEGGENMRYKFFIEPTAMVFLVVWAGRVLGRRQRCLEP